MQKDIHPPFSQLNSKEIYHDNIKYRKTKLHIHAYSPHPILPFSLPPFHPPNPMASSLKP